MCRPHQQGPLQSPAVAAAAVAMPLPGALLLMLMLGLAPLHRIVTCLHASRQAAGPPEVQEQQAWTPGVMRMREMWGRSLL